MNRTLNPLPLPLIPMIKTLQTPPPPSKSGKELDKKSSKTSNKGKENLAPDADQASESETHKKGNNKHKNPVPPLLKLTRSPIK